MEYQAYEKAWKQGRRVYRQLLSAGEYPYLPALDEILSYSAVIREEALGLVELPLELIAGTKTQGRRKSFAADFMPLLEPRTEFAYKWCNLLESLETEGLRDPIVAYEYMNRYYVLEGNKRVSVMKYLQAASVPAQVTRLVPQRTDALDNQIYYEFMDFYRDSGILNLHFRTKGGYARLQRLMGREAGTPWSEEEKQTFRSAYLHFRQAFEAKGGKKLAATAGEALNAYLDVYGYETVCRETAEQIQNGLTKIWKVILALDAAEEKNISMQPVTPAKSILTRILPETTKSRRVLFVYEKNPRRSGWTYGHELGRQHLESVFAGQIVTECREDVSEELAPAVLEQAVGAGNEIIFTTSPRLLKASLRAAVEYPQVKFLNCSLNVSHPYLRSYYGRIYEAKFLIGMIAGALEKSGRIGYLADYPIYGMTANINAFALGAKMVNPRARICLEWSTRKDAPLPAAAAIPGVRYVSGQDLLPAEGKSRAFGLYRTGTADTRNLAMPVWHWGHLYETIVRNILSGAWKAEESQKNRAALNYWWGMSAGVIDVILSDNLPEELTRLIEFMKDSICRGTFHIFDGPLKDQKGELRVPKGELLCPEDIITMDWLLDNVEGKIPCLEELQEEARPVVLVQGLEK